MLFIGDKNHGLGLNLIKRIHNDLAGFDNYLTKVDSINFTFTNISSKSGNFSWLSLYLKSSSYLWKNIGFSWVFQRENHSDYLQVHYCHYSLNRDNFENWWEENYLKTWNFVYLKEINRKQQRFSILLCKMCQKVKGSKENWAWEIFEKC